MDSGPISMGDYDDPCMNPPGSETAVAGTWRDMDSVDSWRPAESCANMANATLRLRDARPWA